ERLQHPEFPASQRPVQEALPFPLPHLVQQRHYGPVRHVAATQRLVEPPVVGVHVAGGRAVELVGGLHVVDEFRECVMRQEREASAETLLAANKPAMISRVSNRRIDERHVAELRERTPRLRIAASKKLRGYL